ncbi:hypothetical protein NKR23_g7241 [Pleurostoma richardsiae]|uniref:Uncharacterized protein n=1 Tax=Pleurostoma richardsiae TaxID=41990 RepID=A0AA38VH16_9PEZI|nr:hypothetical protein NKR23_g7241 [Pleurostoma richardsiae]
MATEHDCDLLLMTFRLLPNLDSIGVREFDGRTGLRNVDYGLKTLRKELGIPNSYRDRNYDWRQPYWKNKAVVCLQRLLYAAGMTNVRPKILKVDVSAAQFLEQAARPIPALPEAMGTRARGRLRGVAADPTASFESVIISPLPAQKFPPSLKKLSLRRVTLCDAHDGDPDEPEDLRRYDSFTGLSQMREHLYEVNFFTDACRPKSTTPERPDLQNFSYKGPDIYDVLYEVGEFLKPSAAQAIGVVWNVAEYDSKPFKEEYADGLDDPHEMGFVDDGSEWTEE